MAGNRIDLDHLSAEQKRQLLRELMRRPSPPAESPLSCGQRPLWLQYQLDPGNPIYNVGSLWRVRTPLDLPALRRALASLVRRHAVLRTTFHAGPGGEPVQRIHEAGDAALRLTDIAGWSDARVASCLHEELARPFDLTAEPAFRVHVLTRAGADHFVQFVFHHIVYDHWSLALLIADLQRFYDADRRARPADLAAVPAQYTDYVAWQSRFLAGPDGTSQWSYWDTRLGPGMPALDLPFDRPRSLVPSHHSGCYVISIDEQTAGRLKELARKNGATPYMVLLAAFHVLLHRWSGQDDFTIVTPTSGRARPEFRNVAGFFVNPVAIRASVAGDPGFDSLLERVRRSVAEALDHADVPFPLVVERYRQSTEHSPLLQVAFTWDQLARGVDEAAAGSLPLEFVAGAQMGSVFDLDLILFEQQAGIEAQWRFSTELFDHDTVAAMAHNFVAILGAVLEQPARRVSAIDLIDPAERQRLLFAWNPVPHPTQFPASTTIVGRFEAQVQRTPESPAVTAGDNQLTYAGLNRRANRLAHRLRAIGIGPEATVGLCVERTIDLPVTVLGILKTGAAYVPVDPQYPPDRMAFMLEDAAVRAVVTDRSLIGLLADSNRELICVDELSGGDSTNPDVAIDPDTLAYIIYTSGSTGRPKGVGVSHRNVMRLFDSTDAWFTFTPSDVWTLFHSAAFDFSVWELWGALLYGGRLVVVPFWVSRSPEAFRTLLAAEGVTVLNQTPSAFRQLIDADDQLNARPLALRYVIFGGEALDVRALRPWVERHGLDRPRLVNMYGITETTVHVTFRPLTRADVMEGSRSVIGEPIPDLQTYLLDTRFEPAPVNMRGELYVGGAGLARGYIRRPRLTAERFVPDPFSGVPGARLYRSGDSGRRLRDGDVEYLGRLDSQVKVRGFRIELGEIEQALRSHPAVGDVVVSAERNADGDTRIAAYVVPDTASAGGVRRLLAWESEGRLADRRWLELPNGLAVVQLNRNETDFLYDEIFGDERYLRNGIGLAPRACVFDVGANIGMFSLYAAAHCPDATIYAFEPIPAVCDLLRLNAELHGVDVRPIGVALSDQEGDAEFTFYPKVSIFSGRFGDTGREREVVEAFLRNRHATADTDAGLLEELLHERLVSESVRCPMTTVSSVMRTHGVERIDLLKVDVEKSELAVLSGVADEDWPRIHQVIVEVHDEGGRLAQVRSLLEKARFRITVEQDPTLAGTGLHTVYAVREPMAPPEPAVISGWSSPGRLIGDLRQHVSLTLPDYMVPSSIVLLDALPLTPNGKLDRRALQSMRPVHHRAVAPRTPLEQQIADIWRAVLRVEQVSITDDFFALGGHSLLATKVISRIRGEMSVELPLRTLFEAPTVEAMALAVLERQVLGGDPDEVLRALSAVEGAAWLPEDRT